jgi:hypothetical protein
MKTRLLLFGIAASFAVIGCKEDDDFMPNRYPIGLDVNDGYNIDKISDDVAQIATLESEESPLEMDCATITDELSGSNRIRTIDFGNSNCTIFTGNQVRGKIILTFTNDFDAQTRTASFAFENFYHNNRYVLGNREVVKTIMPNGHPQVKINLNMIVTAPNGTTFTRIGERIRECTAGYDTPLDLSDNDYAITGTWSTTVSVTGMTSVAEIESPIIIKSDCSYITSGTISYTRGDGENLSMDYGDGTCDDRASFTQNGVTAEVVILP